MWEVCWFYNTSGSVDVQYDLRLRFTNTGMRDGSGSVLSEVWTQSPCDWTLDTGIGIGSPQEAVEAAYPDAVWTHETMIENDQEIPYDLYELTSGDLFMLIRVGAGEVSHISFGGLNAEHFLDEDEPAPADPYTFTPYDTLSGGTVTAYTRTESGWEIQVLTEKRAKRLVTAFNIMDPKPGGTQGEPVIWLAFESGGVAALYDESGAGAIYRLEDQSAFEAALSSGDDRRAGADRVLHLPGCLGRCPVRARSIKNRRSAASGFPDKEAAGCGWFLPAFAKQHGAQQSESVCVLTGNGVFATIETIEIESDLSGSVLLWRTVSFI